MSSYWVHDLKYFVGQCNIRLAKIPIQKHFWMLNVYFKPIFKIFVTHFSKRPKRMLNHDKIFVWGRYNAWWYAKKPPSKRPGIQSSHYHLCCPGYNQYNSMCRCDYGQCLFMSRVCSINLQIYIHYENLYRTITDISFTNVLAKL